MIIIIKLGLTKYKIDGRNETMGQEKKREINLCAHVSCACKTRASQVAFKLC